LRIVSQTDVAANYQSDARTHRTPKTLRAKYILDFARRSRVLGVQSVRRIAFLVQERALVSLVQFIFNTAT